MGFTVLVYVKVHPKDWNDLIIIIGFMVIFFIKFVRGVIDFLLRMAGKEPLSEGPLSLDASIRWFEKLGSLEASDLY